MTPEDEITLARGLSKMKDKYVKGNEEHSGSGDDIQSMSLAQLLHNTQKEAMDMVWYLEKAIEREESKK